MKTVAELAEVIAQAEWEFQGVHLPFRIEPAQRHHAIAEAVLRDIGITPEKRADA